MTDDTTARAGHTALPWRIETELGQSFTIRADAHGIICFVRFDGQNDDRNAQQIANAAFIVQAANSFAAMRDALKEAERFLDYFAEGRTSFVGPGTPKSCLAQIRAALALAEPPK